MDRTSKVFVCKLLMLPSAGIVCTYNALHYFHLCVIVIPVLGRCLLVANISVVSWWLLLVARMQV